MAWNNTQVWLPQLTSRLTAALAISGNTLICEDVCELCSKNGDDKSWNANYECWTFNQTKRGFNFNLVLTVTYLYWLEIISNDVLAYIMTKFVDVFNQLGLHNCMAFKTKQYPHVHKSDQ